MYVCMCLCMSVCMHVFMYVCVCMYVEVAVAAQRDTVVSRIQDLKPHTTDLIIPTLDQEPGLSILC